jgi:hypothetical protein
MTQAELNKIFKGVKEVFCRAGVDTVSEWTPRKAKKAFKQDIEFGEEITVKFNRLGDILFIDELSWIENH